MIDFWSVAPHAIGTLIGALGAYYAVRIDIAIMNEKLSNLQKHFERLEKMVDRRISSE